MADVLSIEAGSDAFEQLRRILDDRGTVRVQLELRGGGIAVKQNTGSWSPTLPVDAPAGRRSTGRLRLRDRVMLDQLGSDYHGLVGTVTMVIGAGSDPREYQVHMDNGVRLRCPQSHLRLLI